MMTIEQELDARDARRFKAEDRALARYEKRAAKAEKMIGELSSGKYYVWPVGGKYREGGYGQLVSFLIRNNYA